MHAWKEVWSHLYQYGIEIQSGLIGNYKLQVMLRSETLANSLEHSTLDLGSIYLLFVTHVKTDIYDACISLSDLIHSSPNFDFDGNLALPLILVRV